MSTLGTIAIIVGAIVLLALVAIALIGARRKRLDSRREEAGELRQDAQRQGRLANRQRAEADERAARAKKAEAEAEERAAAARRERALAEQRDSVAGRQERFARDRHEEARSVDPDVDDESEDRQQPASGRTRWARCARRPDRRPPRRLSPAGWEAAEDPVGTKGLPAVRAAADALVVARARVHRQLRLDRVPLVVLLDQVVDAVESPAPSAGAPELREGARVARVLFS